MSDNTPHKGTPGVGRQLCILIRWALTEAATSKDSWRIERRIVTVSDGLINLLFLVWRIPVFGSSIEDPSLAATYIFKVRGCYPCRLSVS